MKTSDFQHCFLPPFFTALTLAALLILPTLVQAAEADVHSGHAIAASQGNVVHQPAGPMLQEKMARAVEQIERQVNSKGPFVGASGHAMQQGVLLVAEDPDKVKVNQGSRCPANAPVRAFDITAINIEITLNRFLDFFPGYTYVLTENLEAIRAEDAKNKAAREIEDDAEAAAKSAASNCLQGDLIQPLAIRANRGDSLGITPGNTIDGGPTNMIVNGSRVLGRSRGRPATANNPDALVAPGKVGEFEWYIRPDTQEGGRSEEHTSELQSRPHLVCRLLLE